MPVRCPLLTPLASTPPIFASTPAPQTDLTESAKRDPTNKAARDALSAIRKERQWFGKNLSTSLDEDASKSVPVPAGWSPPRGPGLRADEGGGGMNKFG